MQQLKLTEPTDPILNKRAEEISVEDISSDEIKNLIDDLLALAKGKQGDPKRRTMVGLAGPQVGVLKRIIVVAVKATGLGEEPDLNIFINPEIVERSKENEEGREGCFSTGHICGIVSRAHEVTVRAFNREGKLIQETFSGFVARIFQHEIDHLDGIRFPDRIDDDEHLHWVKAEEFGEYREHWQHWDKHCSRDTWEVMKSGSSVRHKVMTDEEIFETLFVIAGESQDKEGIVAAALVRDGNILMALPSSDDGLYHAEYLVLEKANNEGIRILPGDVIYTTVEPCSRRSPGRPVSDCCKALIDAGVCRIVYAAGDPAQTLETQHKLKTANIKCEQVADQSIIEKAREIFNSTQLNSDKAKI